jgi:hypothetical protein
MKGLAYTNEVYKISLWHKVVDFMRDKKCIIKLELDFVTFQVERDNHILGSMEVVKKMEIYAITFTKLTFCITCWKNGIFDHTIFLRSINTYILIGL